MSDDAGTPETSARRSGEGAVRPRDAQAGPALRWVPGIGALTVVIGMVLVAGLIAFDRSLDRVSVDELDEDGQVERDPNAAWADPADRGAGERGATVGEDEDDPAPTPRKLDSTVHVLVAASDDRDGLTSEERRELNTGDALGRRSDSLALVRIEPGQERLEVLRFPRDLLVTRCDGSRGRINAAYAIGERAGVGGATCLVQTIGDWTGIAIHHVVRIDFRGFVDAVDAVGGVDVEVDEPLRDRRAGLDIPAGCVHLDGADALAFVRARHIDDDFGRIGRQQQLVAATLDQVLTVDTLRDPRRLGRLLLTAQRSLQLDDGLSAHRLRAIAASVAHLGSDDLVTRTVDGRIQRSETGISFLHAHRDYARALFTAFTAGELASTPRSASELEDGVSTAGTDATGDAVGPSGDGRDVEAPADVAPDGHPTDGGDGSSAGGGGPASGIGPASGGAPVAPSAETGC